MSSNSPMLFFCLSMFNAKQSVSLCRDQPSLSRLQSPTIYVCSIEPCHSGRFVKGKGHISSRGSVLYQTYFHWPDVGGNPCMARRVDMCFLCGESVHPDEMGAEFGDLCRRSFTPTIDRDLIQSPCPLIALNLVNLEVCTGSSSWILLALCHGYQACRDLANRLSVCCRDFPDL
jgi:hypothetical protein